MLLKKFMGLNKVVRLIILLIPFANWITELAIRWSLFLEKKDATTLVIALLTTFGGGFIIGWVDFFWTLLFDKLSLLDVKLD